MSTRRTFRKSVRRRPTALHRKSIAYYHRALRIEPLEDRRLLAVVTVDTLDDTIDLSDGRTSLREAIFATNLVAGADTIDFAAALTASGPATVVLTLGELRITDSLSITGPGAELLTIDASGSDPTPDEDNGDGTRVFNIDDGNAASLIEVTFWNLTVTGGDVRGRAGAIFNRENLTVEHSAIRESRAIGDDSATLSAGGGIAHSEGTLTIFGSVIANNAADFGGGIHVASGSLFISDSDIAANTGLSGAGIYHADGSTVVERSTIRGNNAPSPFALGGGIYTSGNMTIESTTISGNTAAYGGGVFTRTDPSLGEVTRVVNSTLSGNTALARGGGIRNAFGQTIIEHSTITANHAPAGEGGGVASRGFATAQTIVRSTIIAGNTASDVDFGTGALNTFHSDGYNLIGTGSALGAFNQFSDQTGVLDPMLGQLADNGGPTLTHALLAGSPAINAGDPAAMAGVDGVPVHDQRGEPFTRVYGGRIDVGAFELQPVDVLAGDYNVNGIVDAADATLWRDTFGSTSDLRADGNGDGVVNDADYILWKSNFGSSLPLASAASAMPKPPAPPAVAAALAVAADVAPSEAPSGAPLSSSLTGTSQKTISRSRFIDLDAPWTNPQAKPAASARKLAPARDAAPRHDAALLAWLSSTHVNESAPDALVEPPPNGSSSDIEQSAQATSDSLIAAIDEALAGIRSTQDF